MDYLEIARRVFATEIEYLTQLQDSLDDNFNKAAHLILSTKGKIILCGIGKSGIIARKIAATFSSIGKSSFFVSAAEANHGDLGMICQLDTVVILSNSGESHELAGVISYCREHRIPIISIVGNQKSTLFKHSDISILIPPSCEASYIKMPTTSTTLMSVIGDALAVSIVENSKLSLEEYKKYHPGGSIGSALVTVREVMRTSPNLPIVSPETPMSNALVTMTQKSLGCLIVVNENIEMLGLITDGDLRRHMSPMLINKKAEEIMTTNPKLIKPEDLAINALKYMNENKISNLIVVDQQRVSGVIHLHDCLRIGLKATCD